MYYILLKKKNQYVGNLTKKLPKTWRMSDQMVFYKDTDETHEFWMILWGIGGSGGECENVEFVLVLIHIKNILIE